MGSMVSPFSDSSPITPNSVGAENAKRFGDQFNRSRANSRVEEGRNRSNSNSPSLGSRTTLMAVDSDSLAQLRKKAQRRASASRELAAQTSLLKEEMRLKRSNVEREGDSP